jgi:hypothetical protein
MYLSSASKTKIPPVSGFVLCLLSFASLLYTLYTLIGRRILANGIPIVAVHDGSYLGDLKARVFRSSGLSGLRNVTPCVINARRRAFSRLRTSYCLSFIFHPRMDRRSLTIPSFLLPSYRFSISIITPKLFHSRIGYVNPCDTMSVDLPCDLAGLAVLHLF